MNTEGWDCPHELGLVAGVRGETPAAILRHIADRLELQPGIVVHAITFSHSAEGPPIATVIGTDWREAQ